MYKLLTYGFFFSSMLLQLLGGDNDPLKSLAGKLEKHRNAYPQEKVHLHLDKPYYTVGDTVWFKAYVVDAAGHRPGGTSNVLYVDLVNDRDSVENTVKLQVASGLASGYLALPGSTRGGNYRVRAYTNWMRNFDNSFFFNRSIAVGNTVSNSILGTVSYRYSGDESARSVNASVKYTDMDGKPLGSKLVDYEVRSGSTVISKGTGRVDNTGEFILSFPGKAVNNSDQAMIYTTVRMDETRRASKAFPVKSLSGQADVQFFPESGNLVAGIRSKTAFKAIGPDGMGIAVSGQVNDQAGEKVAEFKAEHAGMGIFAFQPKEGAVYTAKVSFADGSARSYPLPAVQKEGYVLAVSNTDSLNLIIRLQASPQLAPGQFTLLAQNNGELKYASTTALNNGFISTSIPKDRFETGILQVTLFSPSMQPVAERLVFLNRNDQLELAIQGGKATYGRREKVSLELDTRATTAGSYSVSVIDESKVPFDDHDEPGILSNLLLASDLKGYIEKPGYYFSGLSADKARHLDMLMLTQGWRRYAWKDVLAEQAAAPAFAAENDLTISGTVTLNKNPVQGGKVTLFSRKNGMFFVDTLTDAKGRFAFTGMGFSDSTRFVIQARTEKDRKTGLLLSMDPQQPSPAIAPFNAPSLYTNVDYTLNTYIKNSVKQYSNLRTFFFDRNNVLDEVVITESREDKIKRYTADSENLNGPGKADHVITADQLEAAFQLNTYIANNIPGVSVDAAGFLLANRNLGFNGNHPAFKIVLDGTIMSDSSTLDILNNMDPGAIQSIEILKSGAYTSIYGIDGLGGIIVINTKRGNGINPLKNYYPGIVTYDAKGYQISKQFYSPRYDVANPNNQADLRTTIYWNPFINTANGGKVGFDFFNADSPGKYKVVVEGIDADGRLGRTIYRYTVN